MKCFAKDKVVYSSCQYEVKKHGKKTLFKDWIHPEYIEDGRTNELKQYLIQSNRKDLIWSDYMRYISDVINILFIPTEVRDYARDIYVLQEHFDWELITKIRHLAFENKFRTANLCVFPHSEIIHKSNDDETVQSYVNNKDWMIDIAYDACICNDIAVFPNPKYVTYEQLLQITEPIFAKYGWKFGKIENPYLKSFGCNMHCHDCNSYCNSNHNPEKWIKEERVNLGEKLE